MAVQTCNTWPYWVCSQEAKRDNHCCFADFLMKYKNPQSIHNTRLNMVPLFFSIFFHIFMQSRMLVDYLFRVDLPSSTKPFRAYPEVYLLGGSKPREVDNDIRALCVLITIP